MRRDKAPLALSIMALVVVAACLNGVLGPVALRAPIDGHVDGRRGLAGAEERTPEGQAGQQQPGGRDRQDLGLPAPPGSASARDPGAFHAGTFHARAYRRARKGP